MQHYKIKFLLNLLLFSSIINHAQNLPSTSQNYIYTRTILKEGVKTSADLAALPADSVRAEVQYFDGLGRTMQTVSVQASPDGRDIVTPIAYDAFGRQDKNYLPYAANGISGSYRPDALNSVYYQLGAQYQFYQQLSPSIPVIPNPYSQTVFEASPLNRVLEVGAPGQPWAVGSGHTIQTGYEINTTNEVRLWNITTNANGLNTGANSPGYYEAGQLYKNIVLDEHQNKVIEYKDKEGHVVCKKVQDGGDASSPTFMVTQYIYDDFGSLAYVIPPALESITSFTETDQNFNNYIYAYHYDGRLRLIEKKIPGKGWEYTVYNAADRPVYTSDAEQRNRNAWSFLKYDALGRPVISGEAVVAAGTTREALQNQLNTQQKPNGALELFEFYNPSAAVHVMGYTNNTLPNTDIKAFTVTYYDDYTILTTAQNPYPSFFTQPDGTTLSIRTKSLTTVTATNILGTNNYLYTASYYDEKGRVSKVIKQHQLGGVDAITNNYNFVGELLTSTRQHYNNNANTLAVTVNTANTYDHAGRTKTTTETVNGNSSTTSFTYNAIGQLETKTTGNQTIAYAYNPRGWVKSMNAPLFGMSLNYDQSINGATSQFNGNISSQQWVTNGQNHYYTYNYDKANRLLNGTSDESYNEALSYDKMGNILSLTRTGQPATPGIGTLSYNYGNSGNMLQSVMGGYNKTYQYNSNGSMINDGQLNIQYNELNLPKQITGTPVGTVTYSYSAAAEKLTKQTQSENRNYVAGIEYVGNSIDLLHTAEGVARNNGGSYTFEYFLKDHLGNTRVVYNSNGAVLQQTDYYPFGMDIARSQNVPNKYKYNGKEKQDELNQYDYGARFYDAVIGRWHTIDPMSDKYRSLSPYQFCINNPTNILDPNGEDVILLFYTEGNKRGDEMFKAAAYTRKADIEKSKGFNSKKDIVLVMGIKDLATIKSLTENAIDIYSSEFGQTREVGIWSHSGTDGPTGTIPTSSNAMEGSQMTLEGWNEINFNWKDKGTTIGFYGCQSGVNDRQPVPAGFGFGTEEVANTSFSAKLSGMSNYKGVTVLGQTDYSFPSRYTNYRLNSENGPDNFINREANGKVYFQRTYMVAAYRRWKDWNLNEQNVALPMQENLNGKTIKQKFQDGNKK